MAWDKKTRARALERVGSLIAAGMGKKDAVKEVAGEMGVPVRTVEFWLWPSKRRGDSPSKVALAALTEKEKEKAKVALAALLKVAADKDPNMTVYGLGAGGYAVGVDEWIETARAKGFSDVAVLGGVACALFDEAARLRKWLVGLGCFPNCPDGKETREPRKGRA